MVVVSDKILRIVSPFGKPATTAALNKLSLQEKSLERQILEMKSSAGAADIQPEIQRLEDALRAVRDEMKPLKAQLEELKEQEEKEAEAGAVAREAALRKGENPYAQLSKVDLTSIVKK
ncbi:hypothetical protein GCM10007301_48110 [Azorhizobium oxalatiphilum]|uniref:Uncharacterized protein n=1 Tax=Azorhizobium oxalatiphilum TaxID=980631 RepID=A0A917CC18_9HYPH|nr:hypothetical protein [Azorhizobium oxalatiphilum]GGF82393.1 hypothetical protein GCM10007301_48110 [Azorhizobium oxalatiphilum]